MLLFHHWGSNDIFRFTLPRGREETVTTTCKMDSEREPGPSIKKCFVSDVKRRNINRHYVTNHKSYSKFTGKERINKLEQLKRGYTAQQSMFTNLAKSGEAVTEASYLVARETARWSKPFSNREFARDCILKVADFVCPEQKTKLREISLSKDTVTRRIEDLANDLKEQLSQHLESLGKGAFSIALDERTDISDTAQLLNF